MSNEMTQDGSSSKELEKLEKKLKKAEEKMKKAEEKMRIAREEYERTQVEDRSAAQGVNQQGEVKDKSKSSKKDKKRKRDINNPQIVESQLEHESKVEEQVQGEEVETEDKRVVQENGESSKPSKKSKKDKKSKLQNDNKVQNVNAAGNDTESPSAAAAAAAAAPSDIFNDSSLSDQAKKNIYYAYLHKSSHDSEGKFISQQTENEKDGEKSTNWKFSKAKQNWLIRNIFSSDEIPDRYVELVLGYLKTVQGSSRANMVESAKKIITPPSADTSTTTTVAAAAAEPTSSTTEIPSESTEQREQVVNDVVQEDTDRVEQTIVPKEQDQSKLIRAEKLLKTMETESS
ncbi:uncharacterized protein IL334_004935 [Kwoniella shivajii]|uniref:WKF domain-containing protein n=1 Tax=Kwoniella shivajii TaxID=564305 RepID=A0ABZ1D1R0_9TREE|nr:hypothetical protein IL334_004935 [Kwoniella shivajii]